MCGPKYQIKGKAIKNKKLFILIPAYKIINNKPHSGMNLPKIQQSIKSPNHSFILSVINTTDISEFSQDLRVNWNTCQQKAYIVIITSTISLIFLTSLLLYLIYLYKNKPVRDDMSDILGLLKRINNK